MGRTSPTKGGPLEVAVQQVDRWRRGRDRGRMPLALWRLAAEAAASSGVEATATRLRLDADRLRDRMRAFGLGEEPGLASASFVELPAWAPGFSNSECQLELESPTGGKLRISLKGTATAQAQSLIELLWRSPS